MVKDQDFMHRHKPNVRIKLINSNFGTGSEKSLRPHKPEIECF